MMSVVTTLLAETAVSDGFLGSLQTWVPVTGGFGLLIWLVWRLFWKVDNRSQQEIASKNSEIVTLKKENESERGLRLAAEERASRAESREKSLEQRISDLSGEIQGQKAEIVEQRNEILSLRTDIQALREQLRSLLNVDNARGGRPHLGQD